MKKSLLAALVIGLMSIGMSGTSSATPYSSVVDFSSSGTYSGQTYTEISDSNSSNLVGSYSHTINFNTSAASIQSAFLTLNYAFANELLGNGSPKEVWLFNNSSDVQIGQLSATNDILRHSQSFDLSSYISGVSGSSWTIGFKFNETTNGTDTFYLDKSTLAGEYTEIASTVPVPEPGTLMLLGVGMLGLAVYGKRRMNKEA